MPNLDNGAHHEYVGEQEEMVQGGATQHNERFLFAGDPTMMLEVASMPQ